MRSHYKVEEFDAFIQGDLSETAKVKMERHLADCKSCRLYHDALAQTQQYLQKEEAISEDFNERVMEAVKQTQQRRRKTVGRGHGIRILKPAVAVILTCVFLVTAFYFGTKVDPAQRNVVQNPNEVPPAQVTGPAQITEPPQVTEAPSQVKTVPLVLYFSSVNADAIVAQVREVRIENEESLEKIIFMELQKGPGEDGGASLVPAGTKLLTIETKDGICYLNLSTEFVDNHPGGTAHESMLIYSIVNSLTELAHIQKVQFLIEGEVREGYIHLAFDLPFERNESIISTPENTSDAVERRINELGSNVLKAIKDRNMDELSTFMHPVKKLRFTPYSYVDPSIDLTFSREEVRNAMTDATIYTWGVYDGIGDPMELTFSDYLSRFVYDQDFLNAPEIEYNRLISRGNTLNNIFEAYPEGVVIEYHFPGFNPEYVGMDWRSLRLVFEQIDGSWYLVGIVHDQWTI